MKNKKVLAICMVILLTITFLAPNTNAAATASKYTNSTYGTLTGSLLTYKLAGIHTKGVTYQTKTTNVVPVLVGSCTITYKGSGTVIPTVEEERFAKNNLKDYSQYWEVSVASEYYKTYVAYGSHEARTDSTAWGVYTSTEF